VKVSSIRAISSALFETNSEIGNKTVLPTFIYVNSGNNTVGNYAFSHEDILAEDWDTALLF
jgi:hypothetical protein